MKKSLTFTDNGRKLTNLLCHAANVDPSACRSISVRCDPGSVITFTIEVMADDNRLGSVLAAEADAVDVTPATEPVRSYQAK